VNHKEEKILQDNYSTIKKISNNELGTDIKKNSEKNMKGALIGGGIGVVIGIASKKNLLICGLIGLIIGRLIIKK